MRGEVFDLRSPRATSGHEQSGRRFCVVVQSDDLHLSTWLVAPTSMSARAAIFRPEIEILGESSLVLVEQTTAVNPERLGASVGFVTADELARVNAALRLVLAV